MTQTAIASLVERVEKLTGPDREVDALIFRAIGLTELQERHCKHWCSQDGRTDLSRDHYIAAWAPEYTRSLDAAMTLVPRGWSANICCIAAPSRRVNGNRGIADVWQGDALSETKCLIAEIEAATPALALTAAALRALQAKDNQS